MPFPASQQTLEDALSSVRHAAIKLKAQAQNLRDASAVGATGRTSYTGLQKHITQTIARWDEASTVPGLAQYAKDQYDDQTLDIVAEYTAMKAAAVDLRLWIFNNIPKQGDSPLLYDIDLAGTLTELMVNSAAAAGFRTEADALIATIG